MKIIHKEPAKKYVCDNCGEGFNWNKNSLRYGTVEGDFWDGKLIDPVFCSKPCGLEWKSKLRNTNNQNKYK